MGNRSGSVPPLRVGNTVLGALLPGWSATVLLFNFAILDVAAGALTFNLLPPAGKYLSTYQEAGLQVTTRTCPETMDGNPMRKDESGRHDRFERHCMLLFSRSAGSGALNVSEGATSFYRISSPQGITFDLMGLDLLGLSGAIELVSSSGAKLVYSSFNPEIGAVKQDGPPKTLRLSTAEKGWTNITWFLVRDMGGEAILDNLEFRMSR